MKMRVKIMFLGRRATQQTMVLSDRVVFAPAILQKKKKREFGRLRLVFSELPDVEPLLDLNYTLIKAVKPGRLYAVCAVYWLEDDIAWQRDRDVLPPLCRSPPYPLHATLGT